MLLHHHLEYFAQETPDHPFAEMGDQVLTYARANARANQMARTFIDLGLKKGEKFAYLSKNSNDLFLTFYAASKVGVVPVPLNYRLAPPEWRYIIQDSQSKLLIAEPEFTAGIDNIRPELQDIKGFFTIGEAAAEHWVAFDTEFAAKSTENPRADINAQDQVYQMYTSGTTGHPKGVVLSHRAVQACLSAGCALASSELNTKRLLSPMPLYHAAATIIAMACVWNGGTVLIHKEFNPLAVVTDFQKKKATHALLVPAAIQACLQHIPGIQDMEFPHLKQIMYGASPISATVLQEAISAFNCEFMQGYGLTETTAIATILSWDVHQRALNGEQHLLKSCGRAALGTEIRIVDGEGNPLPNGEVGEIVVKGPQLMDGYFNLDEATEKSLRDGWFYTGDAGCMDDEGFVFIQDRIKDMIVSGGENIYPVEVENALFEHPDIADAAVIGIPSEQWGETILAFLVTKNGEELDKNALIDFCKQRLAGYKVPRQFEFISQIPRNPSGKVLKKDLRKPYWEGKDRSIG